MKAILDTDFLFKTHLARDGNNKPLADLIIEFKGYDFFCHEIIMNELSYHDLYPNPVPWLRDKIEKGIVKCYSDRDIIDEINYEYGAEGQWYYLDMLRNSCNSFDSDFFDIAYKSLSELRNDADEYTFLDALKACESVIENGNSMGEKKSFVLAQLLQLKYPGHVVVFCSDDARARQNIAYIDGKIRCLSILGVFQKFQKAGLEKSGTKQFYDSLCNFYVRYGQKGMKVWKHETLERVNVEFEQLFDEIYLDKFEIKASGDLRYKE